MGLSIGCFTQGDREFEKKYNIKIADISTEKLGGHTIQILIDNGDVEQFFRLYRVGGDCTAATLQSEYTSKHTFFKYLPVILEYLSVNARISCFFSRKVKKSEIADWLKQLKKFPIMGLHVQKSNREPDSDCYMITGILKVPNPYINTYNKWGGEDYSKHNHLDVTKFNAINIEFNLPTL